MRDLHEKYPIKELYQITQGEKHTPGMFGYTVPKTYDYNYNDLTHAFSKEKRHDATTNALKRCKDPDPTKYAPDMKISSQKNWKSIGALFSKSKKFTIIDEAMKLSLQTPGPGKYLEEVKGEEKNKVALGKFE